MTLNIDQEVAVMRRLTVRQLRERYAEVFGESTRLRHKEHLVKRIAWRLQANAEGDLSERARQRAAELANDADLRVRAPRLIPPQEAQAPQQTVQIPARANGDVRIPDPGSVLVRNYKGRCLCVTVRINGFEFQGEVYPSLTAVAKAITGKHWNGFHFFGLLKKGGDQ